VSWNVQRCHTVIIIREFSYQAHDGKTPAIIKEIWGEFSSEEPLANVATYSRRWTTGFDQFYGLGQGRLIEADMVIAAGERYKPDEKFECTARRQYFFDMYTTPTFSKYLIQVDFA
jgi:hypothetical protein